MVNDQLKGGILGSLNEPRCTDFPIGGGKGEEFFWDC